MINEDMSFEVVVAPLEDTMMKSNLRWSFHAEHGDTNALVHRSKTGNQDLE